jgi:hypothetical protein
MRPGRLAVVVTAAEIEEIATRVLYSGGILPNVFRAEAWLEANRADLAFLVAETVKDVVFDALTTGLADHPLISGRADAARLGRVSGPG